MSHDVVVKVNIAEAEKFHYLIKAIDSIDRANGLANEHADVLRRDSGVKAEMQFDWGLVSRHVSPQLLITMLRDSHRFQEDQVFLTFPFAAIVVRTAQVVQLDSAFELVLEDWNTEASVANVNEALFSLKLAVDALGGKRAMDVSKLMTQLERALPSK